MFVFGISERPVFEENDGSPVAIYDSDRREFKKMASNADVNGLIIIM